MRHTPDASDVQRMIDRAIAIARRNERDRLSSTLLTIAQEFGGPVRAAVERVAGAVSKENGNG